MKVGRLSNDVLEGAMTNAYEAGFAKAIQCLSAPIHPLNLDELQQKCWEEWGQFGVTDYDPRDNKEDKTSSRGPGRPPATPSPKKPEEDPNLAEKPYDPEFCRARFWNAGDGGQCWRHPCDGDDHCKGCGERRDNPDKNYWGCFDEPLGSDAEHKGNGDAHPWKILEAGRAEKKLSDKKEKTQNKLKEKKAAKEKAAAEKAVLKAAKAEEEAKKKAVKAEEEAKKKAAKAEEEAKKKAAEKEKVAAAEAAEAEKKAQQLEQEDDRAEDEEPNAEDEDPNAEDVPLSGDENDYKEDEPLIVFVDYSHDGFDLKWNKQTNELLDPDDDEVMGMMVLKGEEWVPEIKGDEE
jgi:hypothetical protein